jgi:hypothetical protein
VHINHLLSKLEYMAHNPPQETPDSRIDNLIIEVISNQSALVEQFTNSDRKTLSEEDKTKIKGQLEGGEMLSLYL